MSRFSTLESSKEDIIRKYNSGISCNRLGEEYGCNSGTIWWRLKKWGVEVKKRKKFTGETDDYIDDICQAFAGGDSCHKIATSLGMSEPTVIRVLRANGYDTSRGCTFDKNNLLVDKTELVLQLHSKGKSNNEIARITGHGSASVHHLLKKHGLSANEYRYSVNEHFFDKIDNPINAYVLGLWFADGCVDKKGKLRVGLQEEDSYLLEQIRQEMKYEGPLHFVETTSNRKNLFVLCINRQTLARNLIKLGCIPNKSLKLQFPTEEQVPRHLLSHFIRGYFDGDGSISIRGKIARYVNIVSTDDFCLTLADYLRENLGIECTFYYRYQDTNTLQLFIATIKSQLKFLDWIYTNSTIHLNRKYEKYLILKEQYGNKYDEISEEIEVEEIEVVDQELENNNSLHISEYENNQKWLLEDGLKNDLEDGVENLDDVENLVEYPILSV